MNKYEKLLIEYCKRTSCKYHLSIRWESGKRYVHLMLHYPLNGGISNTVYHPDSNSGLKEVFKKMCKQMRLI